MNINEARIGNFARTKKGELVMVCHIEEKAVIYRKHRLKTKGPKIDDQKSVQDIPLDRSWLFCFGFLIAQMENAPVGVTYWVKDGFCFYEASGHFYIKVGEMIGGKNMALELLARLGH